MPTLTTAQILADSPVTAVAANDQLYLGVAGTTDGAITASNFFANPLAIGSGTPAAGTFTALRANADSAIGNIAPVSGIALAVNGPSNQLRVGDGSHFFGVDVQNGAGTIVLKDATDASESIAFYNGASMRFAVAGAERVRVDSSGNVGIGATSIGSLLHLRSAAPIIRLEDTTTGAYSQINADSAAGSLTVQIDQGNTVAGSALNVQVDTTTYLTLAPDVLNVLGANPKINIGGAALLSTGTAQLEIGAGRTGNGDAVIDLVTDFTTYTDYGLRVQRAAGTNVNSRLYHRGTGGLVISAIDAGTLQFQTNSAERMRIDASGNVGIGVSTIASLLHIGGTAPIMALEDTGTGAYTLLSADNGFGAFVISADSFNTVSGSFIAFDVDGATQFSIYPGVFTIGTSTPIFNIGNAEVSTGSPRLQIGNARTASGFAWIDLVGDTTYSDYGLRLERGSAGANATSSLRHRGTGGLYLETTDAGAIIFNTTATERARFLAAGGWAFGRTTLIGGAGSMTVAAAVTNQICAGYTTGTGHTFVGWDQGNGRGRIGSWTGSAWANLLLNEGGANILIGSAAASVAGLNKGIQIFNGTAPSATPSGSAAIWVESGVLKAMGASGVATTLAS